MTTGSKKKKRTKDPRSTEMEIKRKQDLDHNKLALQPRFEVGYSLVGICVTEHCDVTETIDPAQGVGSPPVVPAQITGLVLTVISDTQINAVWNASGASGFLNYKVYRSTASGFTPGAGNLIASPTSPSYNNTGLSAGTTYYYKVSAVNGVGEGTASAQASKTTTGSAPPPDSIAWWKLDNDGSNSGTAAVNSGQSSGIAADLTFSSTLKAFGTHSMKFDNGATWTATWAGFGVDLDLNFSTGMSWSFWIYLRDNANLSKFRHVFDHRSASGGHVACCYIANKRLCASVFRNGVSMTSKEIDATILAETTWYHVGIVYTAAGNLTLYLDAVPDVGDVQNVDFMEGAISNAIRLGGLITSGSIDLNTRFDGNIDEFRYYRQALTSTQITNLKNTNAL
jgi:Fibronectin type 3 domain-containing protein